MRRFLVVTAISIVCSMAAPSAAASQSVRVVATEAQVRLKPDPNSVVIATIQAGTVLDVNGTEGPWFAVWLPSTPEANRRLGYVAATDVEAFGTKPSTPQLSQPALGGSRSPLSTQSLNAQAAPADDWQLRYDAARHKRGAGKRNFWISMALSGASLMAVGEWVSNSVQCNYDSRGNLISCRTDDSWLYASMGMAGAGGFLAIRGVMQWSSANEEIAELLLARRTTSLTLPLDREGHSVLLIGASRAPAIAYQLSW